MRTRHLRLTKNLVREGWRAPALQVKSEAGERFPGRTTGAGETCTGGRDRRRRAFLARLNAGPAPCIFACLRAIIRESAQMGQKGGAPVMSDPVKQVAMRILDLREISDYTVDKMAEVLF